MFLLFISLFEAVLLGIVLAVLASVAAVWLANRYGLIDIPGKLPHKQHAKPVPLAGGLTVFPALAITIFLLRFELGNYWKLLLPVAIIFITGLADDVRPLRYSAKLLGQLAAAGLMWYLGFQVTLLNPVNIDMSPVVLNALNGLVTILWLAGVTNAFNFVDSMDGLATGTGAIVAAFLAVASVFANQLELARLMGALAGICLILYYLNVTPARLFLGDSGAQTIGFLLASGAMLFNPLGFSPASSWLVPVMILGLPLFDMGLVIFSRLRRARPIYHADRGHTYHRLVAAGLSHNRAIALLHMVSIVLGCLSFLALRLQPLPANAIFAATVLIGIAAILYLDHPSRWS